MNNIILQKGLEAAGEPSTAPQTPLDSLHNNVSTRLLDPEEANRALADRLDTVDPYLANVLRLCADGFMICNKRLCALCAGRRTARFTTRYKVRLERMGHPHHLTLTNFPVQTLTRQALDEVRARFKLLRRRAQVDQEIRIVGGVSNTEIDVEKNGSRWLIGIHATIDAPVPPSENWVREAWQALDGGQQVRIEPIVRGTETQTFGYSTKVPTVPPRYDLLRQYINATRGFRATVAFGNVHPLAGKSPRRRAQDDAQGPASPAVPEVRS